MSIVHPPKVDPPASSVFVATGSIKATMETQGNLAIFKGSSNIKGPTEGAASVTQLVEPSRIATHDPIFSPALRDFPPPIPPQLLRKLACTDTCSVGKVKVLLRVSSGSDIPGSPKVLEVDSRKKTVTLFDPGSMPASPVTPQEHSRNGITAPKMFAFDGIFTQQSSQTEVCSAALSDVIVAVLRGADGAVLSFGQANLGQTYTMFGSPSSTHTLGVIPSAVHWLYRALQERRTHTGSRFSVRVSSLQVAPGDVVTDLLAQYASDDQPPGVFLMEQDPGNAAILPKACEIRAPTTEKAAQLLDAALSNRHVDAHGRTSHFVFTFNIYQYSVDTSAKGGVAGGRSRLHFLDFGALDRGKPSSRLSISALGNVLLAIFNGQKHLPYKDSRLPRLVRECVGSVRCVASLLVHVSAASVQFQETLATVQLASRVHRLRRRRMKPHAGGSGSGGSSEESRSGRSSRGTITDAGSSSVDPSSSEQSCDTVIYVGPGNDDATDGEHPPVYLPSINSGDNRCSMKKALRGSSVDSMSKESPKTPKKSTKSNSKSPKHSVSSKDSSPQRTTNDHSVKTKDVLSVNGGEKCPVNDVSSATKSSAKHLPMSAVSKLCSSGATPKSPKISHVSRHKNHKESAAGGVDVSDEQWIDGPRVSKIKKFEGYKVKGCDLETWIDGPEATYGYMDDNKKTMIQKWVETQNNNSPKSSPGTPTKNPKQTQYKELTQFKTAVDEDESSPKHKHKEKRRSFDSKKDIKIHAKEKDSPHRRKSYSDKPNLQQQLLDNSNSPRMKSQVNSVNSTPSKYYSKDNPIVGCSPVNATSGSELHRSNSLKADAVTKQTPDKNKFNDETQTNKDDDNKVLLNGDCKQTNNVDKQPNGDCKQSNEVDKQLNAHRSLPSVDVSNNETLPQQVLTKEEKDEILQITYFETEEGNIDAKIHREPILDIQEDLASDDGTVSSIAGEDTQADDNTSQCSDDSQQKIVLDEELLKAATKRLILPNNSSSLDGLDEEGEEQLNLSLDRWLADEEREYIEVTEPDEPVEMVDSWVQVTEEDLERTMAEAGVTFVPFLPHRHLLPTLEEEPSDVYSDEAEKIEESPKLIPVSAKSYVENTLPDDLLSEKATFDPTDFRTSSRYEQMISDPNFTAKTHYFAKRLEELRQLHEVYRNLAKQAPRGRNSLHANSYLLAQQGEDEDNLLDGSSISESMDEMDSVLKVKPFINHDSALSSLKFNGNFDFDWKSLLPEELDLQSDYGDPKNEGDESASEMSKECNDPLYDIQSDIMPYLPSNYINLTNLSSSKPITPTFEKDLTKQYEINTETERTVDVKEESKLNGNIISKDYVTIDRMVNGASLSDDENNVKQVKVKKEKRKKKIGILSKSSKNLKKDDNDNEQASHSSKLSWSRFFGSPKSKISSKESPKKSKSSSSKSSGKSEKSVKTTEKKRDKSKETKSSSIKEEKLKDHSKTYQESDLTKTNDKKYYQKVDSERHSSSPKNSKSPSRRSSESRSGSNASNRSQRRCDSSLKNQQQPVHSDSSAKSIGRYPGGFQWDTFQPVISSSSVHGYDSGTDSGVGLKVTPRGKKPRADSRHGESSGYESVIRDSECSSFGSSQDSGLDDDGLKRKDSKGRSLKLKQTGDPSISKIKANCSQIIKEESQLNIPVKEDILPFNSEDDSKSKINQIKHELEEFDEEDVARYENHTTEEDIVKCRRTQEKIRALREKQNQLKKELEAAKGRLSIDKSRWSFELHVEECMTFRDEGYLEALGQETKILSKRVTAAQSHVLLVTSFDGTRKSTVIKPKGTYGIFEESSHT